MAAVLYELWSEKYYVWVRKRVASAFQPHLLEVAGSNHDLWSSFTLRPGPAGNVYTEHRRYLRDFGFDANYSIINKQKKKKRK
jgi:hypothetical protein